MIDIQQTANFRDRLIATLILINDGYNREHCLEVLRPYAEEYYRLFELNLFKENRYYNNLKKEKFTFYHKGNTVTCRWKDKVLDYSFI